MSCAWSSLFVWLGRPRGSAWSWHPWRSNPATSLDSRDRGAPPVLTLCDVTARQGRDFDSPSSLRSQDESSCRRAQRRARAGLGCGSWTHRHFVLPRCETELLKRLTAYAVIYSVPL